MNDLLAGCFLKGDCLFYWNYQNKTLLLIEQTLKDVWVVDYPESGEQFLTIGNLSPERKGNHLSLF